MVKLYPQGATKSNDGDVTGNYAPGFYDGWLLTIDSIGNMVSQHCYGGSLNEGFSDILEVNEGYILLGSTQSNDGDIQGNHHSAIGFSDILVVKIDTAGIIMWQKCYGGFDSEYSVKIVSSNDGGYIIAGNSNSTDGDLTSNYGMYDYWLIKIDSVGDILWQKTYGGTQNDNLSYLAQLPHGDLILTGSSNSNDGLVTGNHGTNSSDIWVIKTDSYGNLIWQKCFGGTNSDFASGIEWDYEGGFIISGSSTSVDGDVGGLHNPGFGVNDMW